MKRKYVSVLDTKRRTRFSISCTEYTPTFILVDNETADKDFQTIYETTKWYVFTAYINGKTHGLSYDNQ